MVFFIDFVFWLIASYGGPGLLLLPVRSSTGMRVTIFRVANYSVREARFFNFVNPFFILKTRPVRIYCCNYNQIGQKSG